MPPMDNVIAFTGTRAPDKRGALPITHIEEDELDVRRWELVMSGLRGSTEYRELDVEFARRTMLARHGGPSR